MDQIKIGAFHKVLRKEKNLTQEQLAEQLGVSGRTVSRWETGNNICFQNIRHCEIFSVNVGLP